MLPLALVPVVELITAVVVASLVQQVLPDRIKNRLRD